MVINVPRNDNSDIQLSWEFGCKNERHDLETNAHEQLPKLGSELDRSRTRDSRPSTINLASAGDNITSFVVVLFIWFSDEPPELSGDWWCELIDEDLVDVVVPKCGIDLI